MEIVELKAEKREEKGKQEARRIRNEGGLPAIVYGKGNQPLKVRVDAKEFFDLTHSGAGSNVVIKLNLASEKEPPTVILKEIQRNPVKDNVIHVDFQMIALDQKIHSNVPIVIIGDSVGLKEGGVMNVGHRELLVEALPMDVPSSIEADITDIAIGDSFRVGDVALSDKYSILNDEDDTIASIVPPAAIVEEVVEEELEEVAEGEEVPEGEEAEEAAPGKEGEREEG